MRKAATKALYLFLCSILGMVLFAMLHRAIFVLYDLVLILDFETYSLGMNEAMILTVDFFTMLAALFFGGWYGTLLGIDWYAAVYGPNAETKAGLFHGFVPHNWRKAEKKNAPTVPVAPNEAPSSKTIKPVIKVKSSAVASKVINAEPQKSVTKSETASPDAWNFDDFLKATPEPKKRTASAATKSVKAKPAVRKTVKSVRKSPTKKAVKIIAD